jgi:hypothetical protein
MMRTIELVHVQAKSSVHVCVYAAGDDEENANVADVNQVRCESLRLRGADSHDAPLNGHIQHMAARMILVVGSRSGLVNRKKSVSLFGGVTGGFGTWFIAYRVTESRSRRLLMMQLDVQSRTDSDCVLICDEMGAFTLKKQSVSYVVKTRFICLVTGSGTGPCSLWCP